jgi:hypothetical protein
MALLNYTTEVAWQKSVGQIVALLVGSGVSAVMQEYEAGYVSAVCFKARTEFGEMGFRLPADVQKTQQVLKDEYAAKRIGRRYANDSAHARNVAWRILFVWIEAQVALIQIGLVKVEQVFLPYAQNDAGETLYEALQKSRFKGLALPDRKREQA